MTTRPTLPHAFMNDAIVTERPSNQQGTTKRRKTEMDAKDQLQAVREGKLSRRAFNRSLMAAGVGLFGATLPTRRAVAQASGKGTFFTYGGYDIPELFVPFQAKNGELPDLVPFASADDAITRLRAGFVVDVTHPCNSNLSRWKDMFQPVDTSRLSNWPDVMPELVELEGNKAPDGNPFLIPFDWGQTSITYRTDLFDLEGQEESLGMLWDQRYSGRIGMFASGAESWWIAAIKAGVPFADIGTDAAFDSISAVLREQRPLVRTYTDDTASLEQALASGELVAALTWNSSASLLKSQGVPVKFAEPKEGALTWVCGVAILNNAPNPDRAYDIIDSLLSVESGKFMIESYGYGHSNRKSFDLFDDATLADKGLSRNPAEILSKGHFQTVATQEWQNRMNETWETIKAGF
jgi:spermidine/putrescine transport system substrate-binding protein